MALRWLSRLSRLTGSLASGRQSSLFIDWDGEIRRLTTNHHQPISCYTKKLKPTDFFDLCLNISVKINKPTKIVTNLQANANPPSEEINENPSEEGNEIPKQNISPRFTPLNIKHKTCYTLHIYTLHAYW